MRLHLAAAALFSCLGAVLGVAHSADDLSPPKNSIPYGANTAVGKFAEVNGIKLYYEVYGNGPPLLLLHGNGQSIADMGYQLKFFADRYQVIAVDSRGHGKSGIGGGRLTYEQMADDVDALLQLLNVKSVYLVGWSDGGNVGLLLAMSHPEKVAKLAVMGAILHPDGAYDWALRWLSKEEVRVTSMISEGGSTKALEIYMQQLDLLGTQPNISVEQLSRLPMPVLVMAGDKDVIRDDHTLKIFHAIPNAHLAIFPGATHFMPWQAPTLFNETVETFFRVPFVRPETQTLLD